MCTVYILYQLNCTCLLQQSTQANIYILQGIHRRLRLSLERAAGPCDLRDCSGKTLRIEPLVSVDSLEKFLNGIVSGRYMYMYMYMVLVVLC